MAKKATETINAVQTNAKKSTKKVTKKTTIDTAVVDKNKKAVNGKIIYGLNEKGVELKGLLEKRNYNIKTGNPVIEIDEAVEKLNLIFSPRKLSVLNFLINKEIKTEAELEKIDVLKKEEKSIISPVHSILEDIQKISKDKKIERSKIFKKINGNPVKFNFLPGDLKILDDLENVITIPSSIARASIETQTVEDTGEEFLVLNFVSLLYDKYTNDIENHHWKIIYDIIDKKDVDNKKALIDRFEDEL